MKFPNINSTAFEIFGFEVKWYGISYALGLFLALILCKVLSKKYNKVKEKVFDDILIWAALGIIFGGRMGYVVFYNFNFYINSPKYVLIGIRDGGMSFHGGIFGLTLACFFYSKLKKVSFLNVMDVIACAAPIGLFLGRLANFINSELWGKETNFFLGVIFPNGGTNPRHPTQLYEAFLEGIVLFFIVNVFYKYKNNSPGLSSGIFLIFYAMFRIFVEFFREPDHHIGYIIEPFITTGIILSLPMIFLGLGLIFFNDRNRKNFKKKY